MKSSPLFLALVLLAILPAPSRAEDPPVFLLKWGTPGNGPGQFNTPNDLAVDVNGNVFVTDSGNDRVEKFTGDGAFVKEVGGTSTTGQGGFRTPMGIAIDPAGNVYVGDLLNSLIQVFDNDLNFIRQGPASAGGGLGIDPTGQFLYTTYLGDLATFRISDGMLIDRQHFAPDNSTHSIGVGSSGAICVGLGTSFGSSIDYVAKLSAAGAILAQWGGSGDADGQFFGVEGLGVDMAENVYVGDGGSTRVQKFTSSGAFLTKWGSLGSGDGQFSNGLFAVAVDRQGNVFVLDAGLSRVQKFGLRPTPTLPRSWGRLKLLYR